ncbi:alpha-1,2-fucosyltransferase [Bradyrhizobium diazoefficiens]|uniref:alpha-1,2-fucosyltransferase n=1 Tax=Bradyrhizobium diazoefficiens TaxID=1355477 RepID=UPI000BED8248|nr:alpha-1,2-fucosyltransferase [Bradyrhizobium diazoefficiens]PDT58062.1 alpha-1,2-fucosyltransferase [Bradyrhizobium diazoefficiens]
MITVSLIGGLGNQMFQYAAGKALAERHGVGLALDLSGFRSYPLRSFLLDRLLVPEAITAAQAEAGVPDKSESNFVRAKWRGRIDRLLGRAGLPQLAQQPHEYREPHFHYDPAFEAQGPRTTLFGYFQSERYFGRIAESLRGWFSPREPVGGAAAEMLARIQASRLPVSVHVRRGDYLNPGAAEFHGILGDAYYREALGRLEGAIGGEMELFVFSDDPAAAEQLLSFIPKSRLVHVRGEPERPWEDMVLMARCRHHIIANSSFSWWGAWLNGAQDKVVIAPRAWFAPNELRKVNTADLYPDGWILV